MELIESNNNNLSIRRQSNLLKINRSEYYRYLKHRREEILIESRGEELKDNLLKLHNKYPIYGHRKLHYELLIRGYKLSRKKVLNLMKELKIRALIPKRNLSKSCKNHEKYPYLLKDIKITRRNQVWVSDITYIRLYGKCYVYLVCIMDVYSRKILSWRLSNSLNVEFLKESLLLGIEKYGVPEIFNSDQGSQYTSKEFTGLLKSYGITISMDGKGRALDNVYIERFWKSLKYEDIYLNYYENMSELKVGLSNYVKFYNKIRIHQGLCYKTPDEKYYEIEKDRAIAA